MKYRMTVRYFLWITGFMFFCMVLSFGVDWFAERHPPAWLRNTGLDNETIGVVIGLSSGLLILPFVLLAAWLVANRLLQPLRRIAGAAEKIGRGHLGERIASANDDDELGRLAAVLNRAFDEYDRNLERHKRFAAHAAHQLRTPLAAIRNTGEICLAHAHEESEYREAVESMLERVAGLTRLCEQLLELGRLDSPVLRSRFVRFDPAKAFQTACEDFAPVARSRGIALNCNLEPGVPIDGVPELVAEVAANLLDNAIRHAPEGGEVSLTWRCRDGDMAEMSIEDDGPGVPEAIRETAFEPFGHCGQTSSTHGSGLGLAIVAAIARLHGARPAISDRPKGGARVRLAWPVGKGES